MAHIRIDVQQKANHTVPTSVLCRFATGPHHEREQYLIFGYRLAIFREPGIFYFHQNVAEAQPLIVPSRFRWESPVTRLQIVTADPLGQLVSRWEHDLGTIAGSMHDYLPLQVRYTAIVVAKGAIFVPPAFW